MVDETSEPPLRAGELARRVGVSKDALRFYEKKGLLPRPERLANNYRVYPPGTAERERGGVPCRKVRALGAAKLAEIEERLQDLTAARDALRDLLRAWDLRLAEVGPGERAGLLESLPPLPTDPKRSRKAEIP